MIAGFIAHLDTSRVDCFNSIGEQRKIELEILISYIFLFLRNCAEEYIRSKSAIATNAFIEVVVGIPATYSGKQKDVLRSAALLAGFNVVGP